MTNAQLAEEVWWSAATRLPWGPLGTTDYPVLLINDETHTLVKRLVGRDSETWRGIALRPREVAQVIERLRGIRRLNTRGKTVTSSLVESLTQFERTGVALVQDGPDWQYRNRIVAHECFHLFQFRNRLERPSAAKSLINHFATSKALPYLRKHGDYNVGNAVSVVEEMAAYIFSGDHSSIGLGRREAEEWFFGLLPAARRESRVARSPQGRSYGVTNSQNRLVRLAHGL